MWKRQLQASSRAHTNRRCLFDAVMAPGIWELVPEELVQCMSSPCLWSSCTD